jgi:hypothetical protein
MNAIALLLALTSLLVLRSGESLVVQGEVREENGVVLFRSGGVLYSLPADEIARITPVDEVPEVRRAIAKAEGEQETRPLRLSEDERRRLIAELEKNRSGTPAPPQKILERPPPPPSRGEAAAQANEEASWRRQARAHEEAVLRARENLELLEMRADELQSKILSLISLGYKSHQFSYDTTQLVRTRERIPYARLEVQRAERALAQFREDARRQGVLPGWLR